MQWVYLGIAGAFEIGFALSSGASQGFTRLWPSILNIVTAIGGIYMLSLALLTLDVGVGYTIWTGIGSVGSVPFGALLFKEKIGPIKLISLAGIILGVLGLHAFA